MSLSKIFVAELGRGSFPGGRSRLYVAFSSSKGGSPQYEWTPEWLAPGRGVADLLREAVRVERQNRPGSEYLREFAQLARDIITEHAPVSDISRIKGFLIEFHKAGPSVKVGQRGRGGKVWELTYGLAISMREPLLKELVTTGKDVEWVLWNDDVIDVQEDYCSLL